MEIQPLALVTGAAHRLGKVFALTLARNNYAILLHYHSSTLQAQNTADQIRKLGMPVFISQADLSQPNQIASLFSLVDQIPNRLQVLVNSAATMMRSDAKTMSTSDWDATLSLNLRTPLLCAQEAAKRMTNNGLIINITDVGAKKGWKRYPAYSVSKAGLDELTKILAERLAPTIRVNAIAPGLVLQSEFTSNGYWNNLIEQMPLKQSTNIDDISAALDLLLKNTYVTGQTLVVDSGYSLVG